MAFPIIGNTSLSVRPAFFDCFIIRFRVIVVFIQRTEQKIKAAAVAGFKAYAGQWVVSLKMLTALPDVYFKIFSKSVFPVHIHDRLMTEIILFINLSVHKGKAEPLAHINVPELEADVLACSGSGIRAQKVKPDAALHVDHIGLEADPIHRKCCCGTHGHTAVRGLHRSRVAGNRAF